MVSENLLQGRENYLLNMWVASGLKKLVRAVALSLSMSLDGLKDQKGLVNCSHCVKDLCTVS